MYLYLDWYLLKVVTHNLVDISKIEQSNKVRSHDLSLEHNAICLFYFKMQTSLFRNIKENRIPVNSSMISNLTLDNMLYIP